MVDRNSNSENSDEKNSKKTLILDYHSKREKWLNTLERLIEYGFDKATGTGRPVDDSRRKWAHAIAYMIQTASKVLNDEKIEELEKRLELIESVVKR